MTELVTDNAGCRYELIESSCPFCGQAGEFFVGWRGGSAHRYGLGVRTRIVRCRSCSLMFSNPFPRPLDFQKMYGDPDKYFEATPSNERLEFLASVASSLRARVLSQQPSLLDVGSGRGEMVAAAKSAGFERVTGLEPSASMATWAKLHYGVTLDQRTTSELRASPSTERFDAASLVAVIEHVADPDALLADVAALLKPRGVLFVDVPNEDHLLADIVERVQPPWRAAETIKLSPTFPPFHVWGFNPSSIRNALARHGFKIVSLEVSATFRVPSDGTPKDRALAAFASGLQRLANRLGRAHNMTVWAERSS